MPHSLSINANTGIHQSHTWRIHQEEILSFLHSEKKPLILGGDARCDSPGYCAKFGSYTLLELNHNVIVDIELVQVIDDMLVIGESFG